MLDDFREWLSDNLRYFMLGGAILLVLLVVVFGVKACTKSRSTKETEKPQQKQEKVEETSSSTEDDKEDEEKSTDQQEKEDEEKANPLETADNDMKDLIEDYYQALGEKDIEALQNLVDDLSPSDESKITNSSDYIENYKVNDVYVKNGLDENSFVVYADYCYYCQDIDTAVPALSQFYVRRKSDGSLMIDGSADSDSAISAYTNSIQKDADVKALSDKIKSDNQNALEENPDLQAFLQGLGEEENEATQAETGTMLIANDVCNVRDQPSGDVIGGIEYGTKVEKLGEIDGWIEIEYEGQTGYVYGELLDEVD